MANQNSDALVFFGATGDLAYKKIFPALQAMVKRGNLNVPVVGVAKDGWNLDQLRARAKDSLENHGGVDPAAFEKLSALLRYVDGDYQDPATFQALREQLKDAHRPTYYLAIPPVLFETVVENIAKSHGAGDARVIVEKPFGHDLTSAQELTKAAFSASITFWASAPWTTCWFSVLQTRSRKHSGTATILKACRSPWRKISASRAAELFTTEREQFAM
jgi:glucose-6-phosphate 1-dehydrogenase